MGAINGILMGVYAVVYVWFVFSQEIKTFKDKAGR